MGSDTRIRPIILTVAIVTTVRVIEGRFPTASLLKCDISNFWRVSRSLSIFRASCKFRDPDNNNGMTEATVVKFCTHVCRVVLVALG